MPDWRTSSFTSNGQSCVEVAPVEPLTWRTSCFTAGGCCVEVASGQHAVLVRDTKDAGHGPVLHLDHTAWSALLAAAITRRPGSAGDLRIAHDRRSTRHAGAAAVTTWHVTLAGRTLHFTDSEWVAFAAGVAEREFEFSPAA